MAGALAGPVDVLGAETGLLELHADSARATDAAQMANPTLGYVLGKFTVATLPPHSRLVGACQQSAALRVPPCAVVVHAHQGHGLASGLEFLGDGIGAMIASVCVISGTAGNSRAGKLAGSSAWSPTAGTDQPDGDGAEYDAGGAGGSDEATAPVAAEIMAGRPPAIAIEDETPCS